MPARKRTGRTAAPPAKAATTGRPSAPEEPSPAQPAAGAPRDAAGGHGASPWRVLGIGVQLLATAALVVGVTMLALGVYTYDNLNTDGTHTVDQQIQMATAGITAGTGLAVAGLVTLGLVFVGFRLGRT